MTPRTRTRCSWWRVGVALAIALAGASFAHGARAPDWLAKAAAQPKGSYGPEIGWVVLDDIGIYDASQPGRIVETTRYAIRILTRDGLEQARAFTPYYAGGAKISSLKAWLIDPAGKVKTYGKDDVVDLAANTDALYSEFRVATISAKSDATVGAVFGWEVVEERRTLLGEVRWYFQNRVPVLRSIITVKPPPGATLDARVFNHPPIAPAVGPAGTTWELRDLPVYPDEPMAPPRSRLAARIHVKLLSNAAPGARGSWLTFDSWDAAATYQTRVHDERGVPSPELENKARELVRGAGTRAEQIRAIAEYVQQTRYVSISIDIERGGGYEPRPAAEVFRSGYGDCKDKAALLRTMLRVAGFESYPVLAFWGDRANVEPDWPALGQFNHCIIAVAVDASVTALGVVQHPDLGRLLIFDPTDTCTTYGDLDYDHQGSRVLVMKGGTGRLVELPRASPELNRVERTIVARLAVDGSIEGTITEKSCGQEAARERRLHRFRDRDDYEKAVRAWIERGVAVSTVREIEVVDAMKTGEFSLSAKFTAPRYGRSMRGQLLVFKPVMVERHSLVSLGTGSRQLPVVLEPTTFQENVRVSLPPGFRVDELPKPVEFETDFGRYEARSRVEGDLLIVDRAMRMSGVEVPADRAAEVKAFIERVAKAEQTPVVLAKL